MESTAVHSTIENLNQLPKLVVTCLEEIGRIDGEVQEIHQKIETLSSDYLRKVSVLSHAEKLQQLRAIRDEMRHGKRLAEGKVSAAERAYEMVDEKIRQLDNDLALVKSQVTAKKRQASRHFGSANESDNSDTENEEIKLPAASSKLKKAASTVSKNNKGGVNRNAVKIKRRGRQPAVAAASAAVSLPRGRSKKATSTLKEFIPQDKEEEVGSPSSVGDMPSSAALALALTNNPAEVLDMPVDPNEPTYCLCRQVSHGSMVACDNPTCPIEWFHFSCVNLSSAPKGRWYCPSCKQQRRYNFSEDVLLS